MNKNKSRKNRVTCKRKNHKKINRTKKGGMFGLFGYRSNKVKPAEQPPQELTTTASQVPPRRSNRIASLFRPIYNYNERIEKRIEEQREERGDKVKLKRNQILPSKSDIVVDDVVSTPPQRPQQTTSMLQNVEYIVKPFLSWFGFFESEPTDTQNNIKLCTPEKNGNNQNECTPDCVYQVANSPSTRDTIIGASLPYFSNFIIEYLNTKIRKNQIKPGNYFLQQYNNNNLVDNNTYYDAFLNYLQNVKSFRIKNSSTGTNILDTYFNESAFNDSNKVTKFNRNDFFDFVREILPEQVSTFELKNLRIDYTGKTLARITELLVETQGETYISSFKDNNVDTDNGTLCNEEKKWVLECIKKRNNNYISVKEKGEWKLHYTPKDKIIKELKEREIINKEYWSKYNLKKKPCGTCWICKQSIFHYYIIPTYTGDPNKMIYLNSKCGEDEHIFPPTVGDIIGTLNMDAKLVKDVVTDFGEETLLAYGLNPSHAFCNQLKSDFLFIALLNINTGEKNIGDFGETVNVNNKYIKDKWDETVKKWFEKSRYNSFENIKSLFHNNANEYATSTFDTIKTYLDNTIIKCLGKQLQISKIGISQMLKLKILIYIIQIGKNIIDESFLKIWKKNMINE
jgi:hypothetical protein